MLVSVPAILRRLKCLLSLIAFASGSATAHAQTQYSLPFDGGTLSWTDTQTMGPTQCGGTSYYTVFTQSSFSFMPASGIAVPLAGGTTYIYQPAGNDECPTNGPQPVSGFNFLGGGFTINFIPANNGESGSATLVSYTGVQGFVNPKYVVVGISYAPPGSSSFVEYTNTTSVGNTNTFSSSFQNDVSFSVSVNGTINGIPAAGVVNGNVTLTATETSDYTQGSSNSTTNTISKASTVSYTTPGTPTFSPVNSDYDYIWLWINPEVLVTYAPPVGSTPASFQWAGYAFDPNDPASGKPPKSGPYVAAPDVIEVQAGCLNGDFSCPSTLAWLNGVEGTGSYVTSGTLARSWQSTANGYNWPNNEGSGLTFSDVCQILTFDPLSKTPSQCTTQNDYTLLNSLPAGTTSDGRYTKDPSPPNTLQYPVGAATELYNTVQTNTQSVAQGTSNSVKQAISVMQQFGTNFSGIFSSLTTLTESDTMTWSYSWLNTLTTTTTLTDELSITGPPDPPPSYNGPVQFVAYQDNMFGTFVFVPVPN